MRRTCSISSFACRPAGLNSLAAAPPSSRKLFQGVEEKASNWTQAVNGIAVDVLKGLLEGETLSYGQSVVGLKHQGSLEGLVDLSQTIVRFAQDVTRSLKSINIKDYFVHQPSLTN